MSETPWQKYKKSQEVIENTFIENKWVDPKIYSKRLTDCILCPEFSKETKTCNQCGCFMIIKTKIPNASCPLGKW